jgi:hypothetical protein
MPITATNNTPISLPPTRVLSTTKISTAQAQTFLANFILTADADRNTSARGDLVLSDQRRIEKALQGVYMPKPIEKPIVKAAPVAEPAAAPEEEEQQDEEMAEAGEEEVEVVAPSKGTVDKAKRKAEKKARAKEEKKRKAEERAKEKEK